LWIGIAITVAYAVLIEKLGFFLCTFVYLAAFMWIGRYRRWGVILVTSLVGSLAFMFMFMKIVYVSLPLGVEPFSQVSFLLMRLMGIK
jgi:putative tricarboxylic transport membrane protein